MMNQLIFDSGEILGGARLRMNQLPLTLFCCISTTVACGRRTKLMEVLGILERGVLAVGCTCLKKGRFIDISCLQRLPNWVGGGSLSGLPVRNDVLLKCRLLDLLLRQAAG